MNVRNMAILATLLAAVAAVAWVGYKKQSAIPVQSFNMTGEGVEQLPEFSFPDITGGNRSSNEWRGKILVINFWATWCPPCRAEHPKLKDMAANGIRIVGVNIRDDNAKATAYLTEEGDPFIGVVSDPTGRRSIDWGVTAPPETFIVNGDGTVLFKFIGPLIGSDYEQRFLPELQKALGQGN